MSGWDAIVFDLDDTLYAERDYVFSGFRAVAVWGERCLGFPSDQIYAELVERFEHGSRRNTFDDWLASRGLPPDEYVDKMVQVYRRHEPVLPPFPGVTGLLDRLVGRCRLGLVSDGWLAVQRRKLTALGLERYFGAVVFSDEWGRAAWKPSPRPFEIAMERLAARPAQSVYVADNPQKDFLGARRAGMFAIRLRRPEGLYRDYEPVSADHAPHYETGDLVELEHVLSQSRHVTVAAPCRG